MLTSDPMHKDTYLEESNLAVDDNDRFWSEKAKKYLEWHTPFTIVHEGTPGNEKWFKDGKLNACYNCIDRWAKVHPDKTALIFDSNTGSTLKFTYKEALLKILEISNILKKYVKFGESVTLYLSMSPDAVFTALACARLGIPHSAVFGGFAADSLRLRINDSNSKLVISQDYAFRGDKKINFLKTVQAATEDLDVKVLIYDSENTEMPENFIKYSTLAHSSEFIEPVNVESEHHLFYLYTSGSTGLPKGLIHSTAGYLLYTAYTLQTAFDIKENDIFCCTADIGWITGHSYCVYGPLALGITTVILEGLPNYPSYYRFFDIVDKYKITHLYTAPTTVRILKAYFDIHPLDTSKYDLSSLRLLGSVGEPINKEAYKFFSKAFGGLHIVDTYFQTETGGIMIAPIPGVKAGKPECAALPIPGIVPMIKVEKDKDCSDYSAATICVENLRDLSTGLGKIFISLSWPGISRGILNDQKRYMNVYFSHGMYFTGDEGMRDQDGDYWIMGRADDVINVSGHRISTAEVESAACTSEIVSEAAVVAISHEIKGQSMILFVVLKCEDKEFEHKIKKTIGDHIGNFCKPDRVVACTGIPKTATGKIMRRVLRSIVLQRDTGDLSTCINKEVVPSIRNTLFLNNVE